MTARDVAETAPETTELSLAEVRTVQLGVLVELDRICREHGLTYYLAYGTLLGAVRHGGYIPWDDDIDVMMPRADYDRLVRAFDTMAPSHLTLGCTGTQAEWPFPWAKIGDLRTEVREPLDRPLPLSVNIDVFPIDVVPAGRVVRTAQAKVLQRLRWAVELRYIRAARGREWHGRFAITVVKPLLRLVPTHGLIGVFTRLAGSGRTPGDRSGVRVGSFDWSVPSEQLGEPVEVTFEERQFLAPADTAAVLTRIYGDYTTLPPETQRISEHAFTARWSPTDR